MGFGVECSTQLIWFSASNEPEGFDGKLWSLSGGGGGNDENVLISDFQMLAGMKKNYSLSCHFTLSVEQV